MSSGPDGAGSTTSIDPSPKVRLSMSTGSGCCSVMTCLPCLELDHFSGPQLSDADDPPVPLALALQRHDQRASLVGASPDREYLHITQAHRWPWPPERRGQYLGDLVRLDAHELGEYDLDPLISHQQSIRLSY